MAITRGDFDRIEAEARGQWDQLDADPVLAAPWHQLFRQVAQTPRHVLSELLQNADDAGASFASARIEDGAFIFEHDGADFEPDHLRSLCRFGYSNKRSLWTIGFRGIGFKATFSLGPTVEVRTPSASFAFDARRFTQPRWLGGGRGERVVVRVALADDVHLGAAVRASFGEWTAFPLALLFFRNVERLLIDGAEMSTRFLRRGPAESEEIELTTPSGRTVHARFRARPERLPDAAVAEVRQERMTEDVATLEAGIDLVTCEPGRGRVFAVLPTDVELPFGVCVNAPFVQDPARIRIKSPSVSATNRWLLERAGRLAVSAMTSWLGAVGRPLDDRARAYGLLPDQPPLAAPSTIQDEALTIYCSAFQALGASPPVLLGSRGSAEPRERILAVPHLLHSVWSPDALRAVFGTPQHVDVLAEEVPPATRDRLVRWEWLVRQRRDDAIARLARVQPPRPATDAQLAHLWTFVAARARSDISIVPVMGSTSLHRAVDVARLRPPANERDEEILRFLADRIHVFDERFAAFVSKDSAEPAVAGLLRKLGLDRPTDDAKIFTIATRKMFGSDDVEFQDALALLHILAASDARMPPEMPVLRRDGEWRSATMAPLLIADEGEDALLAEAYIAKHAIDARYLGGSRFCQRERVRAWLLGPRGDARAFPTPVARYGSVSRRSHLEARVKERGGSTPIEYRYKGESFVWGDFDFDEQLVAMWTRAAQADATVWARVLGEALRWNAEALSRSATASVQQVGSTGNRKALQVGRVRAAWVDRLQGLPCVLDADGVPQLPSDLVLLTQDTRALQHVEKFVHRSLDDPHYHAVLRELGVRDRARSVKDVLGRLRAIVRLKGVPAQEVVRLYRLLDGASAAPAEQKEVRAAFDAEALIMGDDGRWYARAFVTRYGDADLPELARVIEGARDLGLWARIGVPDRPSTESVIEHLRAYPTGHHFAPDDGRRVARIFERFGPAILEASGRWISLNGELLAVATLRYQVASDESALADAIGSSIRGVTALVPAQHRQLLKQHGVRPLASATTWTVSADCRPSDEDLPDWLRIAVERLARVQLGDDAAQGGTRKAATELLRARWGEATDLLAVPLVDGVPAGPSQPRLAVWTARQVVRERDASEVQVFDAIVEVLAGVLGPAWTDLLRSVAFRSAAFVREYVETHVIADAALEVGVGASGAGRGNDNETREGDGHHADGRDADVVDRAPNVAPPARADEPDDALRAGDASDAGSLDPGDGDELDEDDGDGAVHPATRNETPVRPVKPRDEPVMHQWLAAVGFRWDAAHEHWRAGDGRIAVTAPRGSAFNWEIRREDRADADYIWSSDAGDLGDGIDLPGTVGDLLQRTPNTSIVVRDSERRPVRLTGRDLKANTIAWNITRYRLRSSASS